MKIFGYTPAQIKKTLYTVLGFVIAIGTAATQSTLFPQQYLPIALTVVGAATAIVVFLAKNADVFPPIAPLIPTPVVPAATPVVVDPAPVEVSTTPTTTVGTTP